MKRFIRICSVMLAMVILATTPVVSGSAAAAASDAQIVGADTGDVGFSGDNTLGELLSDRFDEQKENEENGSRIFDVVIEGKDAAVEVQTATDAKVIVSVYDEANGSMLGTGMTEITPADKTANIHLAIDTMPASFSARAFLVDAETNVPLCKQYECDTYTSKMQAFFAKTTDDFDAERVINLDADKKNNFLVYNSQTVVIDENGGSDAVAEADAANKRYVIQNIDAAITSLKPGDILSYPRGGDMLIIKVASMQISGTTATIYGGDLELEEVFDYIRIDAHGGLTEAAADHSNLGEDVRYLGTGDLFNKAGDPTGSLFDVDSFLDGTLNYELKKYEGSKCNVSGKLGFKCGANVECYYDFELFEDDELEVSVSLNMEASLSAKLELSNMDDDDDPDNDYENDILFELGTYGIAVAPGVYVDFTPSFVLQGKVEIEIKGTLTGEIGKEFKHGEFSDTSKDFDFDPEFRIEGEIFVSLSLKPRFKMIGDAVSAHIDARSGVLLSAKMQYGGDAADTEDEIHDCITCIDGDLKWVLELTAEVSLFHREKFTWEADILKLSVRLKDFYYSFTTETFAWTSCPDHRYRQTICLMNEDHSPIAEATVNGELTDDDGAVSFFFTKGEHKITIKNGDFKREFMLDVRWEGKKHYILSGDTIKDLYGRVISSSKASDIVKGNCGDGVMYTYDGKGFLAISGNGSIFDYDVPDHAPWYDISEEVTSINIREGVTGIGENAFAYFENLKSIAIAETVSEIGKRAFSGCFALESVSFPLRLKKIGEEAFFDCDSLKKINLYNVLTSIGYGAFDDCDKLESVNIPDSVTELGENAFSDCSRLKNVTIGDGVIRLDGTFISCDKLETVKIGKGVVKIECDVFNGCPNLKSIDVSDSNEDYCDVNGNLYTRDKSVLVKYALGQPETYPRIPNGVERIAPYAFAGSEKIKYVFFPDSTREIGNRAFYGCANLANVSFGRNLKTIGERAFEDCKSLGSFTPLKGLTDIGQYAFLRCENLSIISLPDSVSNIEYGAFDSCAYCNNKENWENGVLYIGNHLIDADRDISGEYRIKDGTLSVGAYAFECCEGLTDISIPDTVTKIGDYAFRGCKSLESAVIPYGVTTIGSGAFYGCERLATVNLPDSVTNVGGGAYDDTAYFKNQSNRENGALYIGKHLIRAEDCPSDTCNVKSGTLTIADDAFSYEKAPQSVYIPESVRTIGEGLFFNIGYSGKNIDIKIAAGNTNYHTVDGNIYNKDKTVLLHYDPKHIDPSFTVPAGVTTIAAGAFFGCEDLFHVTIANDVTTICSAAFDGRGSITTIAIGKSVRKIGNYLFYNWIMITDIYYEGSAADWNRIDDNDYYPDLNYCLREARMHYNSSMNNLYASGSVAAKEEGKEVGKPAEQPVGASVLEDTFSRSGLVPGSEALLLIVEGREDDFAITDTSLMFVAQTTVGTDGTASFENKKDFLGRDFVVLICGKCAHDSVHKLSGDGSVLVVCDGCGEVLREIPGKIGDVDGDGNITISDATMIQRYLAETVSLSAERLLLADTDGSGEVTINDATQLQKYLAEYDVTLG